MITVTSPQGVVLVWCSFLTGLFMAFCLCSVKRIVVDRIEQSLPPGRSKIVQKIYEPRPPTPGRAKSVEPGAKAGG